MSSNAYDLAIVCKEAAKDYMETNPDFQEIGPVIYNSDILVEKNYPVKKIGITANKDFHKDFAIEIYGEDIEIYNIIPNGLPYALEQDEVDAIIYDLSKMNEEIHGNLKELSSKDYVTNIMIGRKDFLKTKEYISFKEEYNKMVEKIQMEEIPKKYIEEYTNLDERSLKYWRVKLEKIK